MIDNIDFKEYSFTYGNIYDVICITAHVNLRIVFQFSLPISIHTIINNTSFNKKQLFKVGPSQFTDNEL